LMSDISFNDAKSIILKSFKEFKRKTWLKWFNL
jgi:hypothetical protein